MTPHLILHARNRYDSTGRPVYQRLDEIAQAHQAVMGLGKDVGHLDSVGMTQSLSEQNYLNALERMKAFG